MSNLITWLDKINMNDLNLVGGKNASLGEMYQNLQSKNIIIPNAFVLTINSYNEFINFNKITYVIEELVSNINNDNLSILQSTGIKIRDKILNGVFPKHLKDEILENYKILSEKYNQASTDVAVRSSSTAEDLPDASFAGLQETFLNVNGYDNLLLAIKNCFASLYNDRAISYRKTMNYEKNVSISVCVQKMARSDKGSSGVAFSIDSETGFKDIVLINSSWGLGEMIVGGQVKPDEFLVFKKTLQTHTPIIDKILGNKNNKMIYQEKNDNSASTKIIDTNEYEKNNFSLSDENILKLSKWVVEIEKYYSKLHNKWCPMDIEWAFDGETNTLFIVQARPETVNSNKNLNKIIQYEINNDNEKNDIILTGIAVGDKIGSGNVNIIPSLSKNNHIELFKKFKTGDVLVTDITDPDWEPIMKRASAIITNKGGRVCHAAIVARELGIPAIVGSITATEILKSGSLVTVSCAEGEKGYIYNGKLEYITKEFDISTLPNINTKILLNIGSPEKALKYSFLPNSGVGLAREEFIINNFIGIHPLALINHKSLKDQDVKNIISEKIKGYESGVDFFIKKLSFGIARIASAFYPKEVIVRLSDFKSNEYFNLIGGKYYEPMESNPMIGWRGCSRYYSNEYRKAFELECKAIKNVRDNMGLNNIVIMLPFCRTPQECRKVLSIMEENGLKRHENNLKIALMCELPVNCILADEFCKYVDIFSIGSNDLTQTTLAVDRDSELISHLFDERNPAVKKLIKMAIISCKKYGVKIGICGQGPSDHPDFAQFLVENDIDTISITPDAILKTINAVKEIENKLLKYKF